MNRRDFLKTGLVAGAALAMPARVFATPQAGSARDRKLFAIAKRELDRASDLIWKRDYDPSLPDVIGDEAMLIQALLNIIRNAAQALESRSHPSITIRTRAVRQFTISGTRHKIVAQIDSLLVPVA